MVVDVTYNGSSIVTNNVAVLTDSTFLTAATMAKWDAILGNTTASASSLSSSRMSTNVESNNMEDI